MKKNKSEAIEANQQMDDLFNGSGTSNFIGDSDAETANHRIQEKFYGDDKDDNTLPFHVDINNPPIKK
jgi:hypothetical protein